MSKPSLKNVLFIALITLPLTAFAQSADTWVDVGPGHATGGGSAQGDIFQHVDTTSHVGPNGSMSHAVGIGVDQDGVSFSTSFGANGGGQGVGGNFNMTIGREGTHVSQGGVQTQGGNTRVQAGGGSGQYPGGIAGGNLIRGFGNNTQVHSQSTTQRFPRLSRMFP